ncbi:MAG TPA: SPOR domain-containing protein [Gaiellaceae bacterium]
MNDNWRIRIDVGDEHAGGLIDRLGLELGAAARELAQELEQRRLAVSRDGDEIFVYAGSRAEAEQALAVVQAELTEAGVEARTSSVEHWLAGEERWDDEPRGETWEDEEVDHGHAPWEVRVSRSSHHEAETLADQLEQEGYKPVRRWHYLIVGTDSKEDADALAARVHGAVEPGGALVYETMPGNPFAVFGGLGSI